MIFVAGMTLKNETRLFEIMTGICPLAVAVTALYNSSPTYWAGVGLITLVLPLLAHLSFQAERGPSNGN
jgi:hypothetical protein